jgi:hypothetical protein
MSVIPLTLVISLCLVFTFLVFFLREHSRSRLSSAERDSLLPFTKETPNTGGEPAMVISFKGIKPKSGDAHDPGHKCSENKPDHKRCPGCNSHDS